jgi:hypothetical protein
LRGVREPVPGVIRVGVIWGRAGDDLAHLERRSLPFRDDRLPPRRERIALLTPELVVWIAVAFGAKLEWGQTERLDVEPALLHRARDVRVAAVAPLLGCGYGDDLSRNLVSHGGAERHFALRPQDLAAEGIRLRREHYELDVAAEIEVCRVRLVPASGMLRRRVRREAQPGAVGGRRLLGRAPCFEENVREVHLVVALGAAPNATTPARAQQVAHRFRKKLV